MGVMNLALAPGGPERLELTWESSFKNLRVTLDGKLVGTAKGGQGELKEGVEFRLPDGSDLRVQLDDGPLIVELEVLRNGRPLPGSPSDPKQVAQNTSYLLYGLAGLYVLLGVVALELESAFLQDLGMGINSIALGPLIAALGFFTSRGARVALTLAIALFACEALFFVTGIDLLSRGYDPSFWSVILRVLIILSLLRAVQIARKPSRGHKNATLPEA